MSNEQNPFESAIAALEERRVQVNAEIDSDIAKLREIGERLSGTSLTSAMTKIVPTVIEKDTFYNLTLPDAARKYLSMGKKPKTTNDIIDALEKGGLKRTTYASMYTSLSRRESNIGDIVNVNGDWELPEWYGAKAKPMKRKSGESLPNAVEVSLEEQIASERAAQNAKDGENNS